MLNFSDLYTEVPVHSYNVQLTLLYILYDALQFWFDKQEKKKLLDA